MSNGDFQEKLRSILEPVLTNISEMLSTALNQKVEVTLGEIRPTDMEELKNDFPEELVVSRSTFTEGIAEEINFLTLPNYTAILADLMLMGEGDKEFSKEEHLDGTSELFNQVGGVLCTYLSDVSGTSVKLDVFSSSLDTVDAHADEWATYFRIDLAVQIQGFEAGTVTLQLASQVASDLQSFSREELSEAEEDRPPPAVLDEDFLESLEDDNPQPEVRPVGFEDFGPADAGGAGTPQSIEALMDLDLPVIIELGRTTMFIRDILELSPGSIVELNKLSGEPVDLYINDKRFARGEVVVIDENFGIRITDLVKVEDRIRSLR